jgi:hypothetical protein
VEWTGTTAVVQPTSDTNSQPLIPNFAIGKTYELNVVGDYTGSVLTLTVTATEQGAPANQVSFSVTDSDLRTGTYFGYRGGLGGGATGTFLMDFDNLEVVPEPATLALLAFGALSLIRSHRRRA